MYRFWKTLFSPDGALLAMYLQDTALIYDGLFLRNG